MLSHTDCGGQFLPHTECGWYLHLILTVVGRCYYTALGFNCLDVTLQGGIMHFTLKPTWVSSKVPVPAKLSGTLPAVQQACSHL